jgi:hypothetical protein
MGGWPDSFAAFLVIAFLNRWQSIYGFIVMQRQPLDPDARIVL